MYIVVYLEIFIVFCFGAFPSYPGAGRADDAWRLIPIRGEEQGEGRGRGFHWGTAVIGYILSAFRIVLNVWFKSPRWITDTWSGLELVRLSFRGWGINIRVPSVKTTPPPRPPRGVSYMSRDTRGPFLWWERDSCDVLSKRRFPLLVSLLGWLWTTSSACCISSRAAPCKNSDQRRVLNLLTQYLRTRGTACPPCCLIRNLLPN